MLLVCGAFFKRRHFSEVNISFQQASVTLIDGSPAVSLPVTATVTLAGKTPMKKTELSNKEGLVPFTFDIPRDAQTLQIMVKKTQTSIFKNTPLRRARKTITNDCEDDEFSLT